MPDKKAHCSSRLKTFSLIVLVTASLANAAEKEPIRIMPLGDSITAGSYGNGQNGIGGYRVVLWDLCQKSGLRVDFVGTLHDPPGAAFDADHQGWRGWRADQLNTNVAACITQCKPQIILLQIGVNDILNGATVDVTASRFDRLLGTIHEAAPEARVCAATMMNVLEPNDYNVPMNKVSGYNARIPRIVADRARQGMKVQLVDLARKAGLREADFSPDRLHPNDSGYRKIAEAWFLTLRPIIQRSVSPRIVDTNSGPEAARAAVTASGSSFAWNLPEAREVELGGSLGEAWAKGVHRLTLPPYDSAAFLRSDFSFETNRVFVNYSGDISGRFIQIMSLVSPSGQKPPAMLAEVLNDFDRYQKADGHFGRAVDWGLPLEPENPNAVLLPIFWGNSRLLVGLLAAYHAFGREDCLAAAKRMGDFYLATANRFLDPGREPEYRMTGTYAAGYPTDYFPGLEGLVQLYQATHDKRYLQQAECMAEFFRRFDTLPLDHSHGNLVTHYGLLLLYEATGNHEYLRRTLAHWQRAVDGGFVWPTGGVGEKFRVSSVTDEGCSEADWLRLNLRLWELTGENRFLAMAERLLWNHYPMNRTANGGYGHHNFVWDSEGPLLMKPGFTEAVWCCTFQGLVGLHALKRHVIVGSPRGVFINFPVSAAAPVRTGRGRWQVSVAATEPKLGQIHCRVRIDPLDGSKRSPEIFVRRPEWATEITVTDARGRNLGIRKENGYLRLSLSPGAEKEVTLSFAGDVRLEDRRMRPVVLNSGVVAPHPGITLFIGPHLLLANSEKPKPVLAARVGRDGRLIWPTDNRWHLVDNFNTGAGTSALLNVGQPYIELTPWENARREAPAAFVFDLITVPQD
jgi:lysophospholipase L1-like esterase